MGQYVLRLLFLMSSQLHADFEPLLPRLHGAGLGLFRVHDGEEHRSGEGAALEGDPEDHGGHQRCHLVHVVHRQLLHDGHQHSPPYSHHHGEKTLSSSLM